MSETPASDRFCSWRPLACIVGLTLAACSGAGKSGGPGGSGGTQGGSIVGSTGGSPPSLGGNTTGTGGGTGAGQGGSATGGTGGTGGATASGGGKDEDGGVGKDGPSSGEQDASVDLGAGTGGTPADGGFGTCPTTLPPLAADSDTGIYANKPNIPHGIVATVKYAPDGTTMHIYTPPDYATNTSARYPVLYLNHGIGETDAVYSCTTGGPECGYAGWILDNLLAAGKAVPMIMVMTDTRACADVVPAKPPTDDACTVHYRQSLMPYVEKNYRTINDRNHRAIGGLSLGGVVSFNVGLSHLELFSQLYIYSSGFFDDTRATWESNMGAVFKDPKTTNHLLNAPIYMAAGDTDVALANAKACFEILKKNGIKSIWQPSTLDHSWVNWRRYLAQTLQIMFTNTNGCD